MTDQRDPGLDARMDQQVNAWLRDTDLPPDEAEHGLHRVLETFPTTPQTRRRFLGRWLDRGGGVRRDPVDHDHPPDTDRRNRLMITATATLAGFALLAVGANVLVTDTDPPAADSGATHFVGAAGGDFTTIADAVAAAEDGDMILMEPGDYPDTAVVIEKDITLAAADPVSPPRISAPQDGPTALVSFGSPLDTEGPYAILLLDSEATVSGLHFTGLRSTVHASGGAPTVSDSYFEGVGYPFEGGYPEFDNYSVTVNDGAQATVRGNTFEGGGGVGVLDRDVVQIMDNVLTGGSHICCDFGDTSVVRGNTVEGPGYTGIAIYGGAGVTVEGNSVSGPEHDGIEVWGGHTVSGNIITGAPSYAIVVGGEDDGPIVRDNVLRGNQFGITWSAPTGELDANSVTGGKNGVLVVEGAPMVTDNTIEDNELVGLSLGRTAEATVSGNRVCGSRTNLVFPDGSGSTVDDTNEICQDLSAE